MPYLFIGLNTVHLNENCFAIWSFSLILITGFYVRKESQMLQSYFQPRELPNYKISWKVREINEASTSEWTIITFERIP